jgi:hypothetical protein
LINYQFFKLKKSKYVSFVEKKSCKESDDEEDMEEESDEDDSENED